MYVWDQGMAEGAAASKGEPKLEGLLSRETFEKHLSAMEINGIHVEPAFALSGAYCHLLTGAARRWPPSGWLGSSEGNRACANGAARSASSLRAPRPSPDCC